MRTLACLFALTLLSCWNATICLAQQAPGPATLENLLSPDEPQKPTAAAGEATQAAPKRPAGTVARPKDGVQHPDLEG